MTVTPPQRFTKANPCPICGGYDMAPRGQGIRCFGFQVEGYAHCTRVEKAGSLPFNENSQTYAHRLSGVCGCGCHHSPEPSGAHNTNPRHRIIATYDYASKTGELVFQVVRYDPKSFKQRRPNSKGGWIWNLKAVKRPLPLYRLPELMTADLGTWVYFPEGEDDANRLASLGLVATTSSGGAGKFGLSDAEPLYGRRVAILPDNDEPGRDHSDDVAHRLQGIAADVKIVELPELSDGGDVSDWLNAGHTVEELSALVESTSTWIPSDQEERRTLIELARPLLDDPTILHKAIHTIEDMGVVGERQNIGIIHLQVRSRALPRPVNLEVNSPSSAGKTYVVVGALKLEDPSAYYELTAGSEKALIYLGESLENRIVYFQEPEGFAEGVGAAVIKSLAWEGRLKYDTVVKEGGKHVGMHIEKEGPTGLIVTTTRPLQEQLSNRMLRVEVDASEEQTRRILAVIADSVNGALPSLDLSPWHAMSKFLGEPAQVEIAFAHFLAEQVSAKTLGIRRDFSHLLHLIAASAVDYSYQRERMDTGSIQATLADYAHVHALVGDAFRAAQAEGIVKADREMVGAAVKLSTPANGKPGDEPVTQAALRDYLKLSKSSGSYRVRRLLKLGYLANLEEAKGRGMKLVPGAPLPDEPVPLPSPCDLAAHLVAMGRPELVDPFMDPVTGAVHDCHSHLAFETTNDEISGSVPPSEPLNPCPRCVASPYLGSKGFIAAEPFEPSTAPGVQGVQSRMNPSPSDRGSKLDGVGGSTRVGEEQPDELRI